MPSFFGSGWFGLILLLLAAFGLIPLLRLGSPVLRWWEIGGIVALAGIGIWGLVLMLRENLPWSSTRRGKGKVSR
jgi:hypothetical protein